MKKNTTSINSVVEGVSLKDHSSVLAAANKLLENTPVKRGAKVAVVEGPAEAHPADGQQGTVTGLLNNGFAEVTLENGAKYTLSVSLLVPLG